MPRELRDDGLALLMLALPTGTIREHARHLARQVLREAIGSLLSQPTETVALVESPHGPTLDGAARDIRIRLSYAGDWVLIGLAKGRALGVDMMRVDNLSEIEALARLYLPAASCHAVLASPVGMRDESFAYAWAEMEAGRKCLGLPLTKISVERESNLRTCNLLSSFKRFKTTSFSW